MKYNKYSLLILLGIAFFSSCKKYLDVKSNSVLVVPTTLENFQAILDNVDKMNNRITPSFGESSSDDFFIFDEEYNTLSSYLQDVHKWEPAEYYFGNDWDLCYNVVYNANLCLDEIHKIEQSPLNADAWRNIKGSAHFFRAFYFMQLVWEFAKAYDDNSSNSDLGIVLRLSSDYNVPSVRASVRESYQQIISDANEAAIFLPAISRHPLRPSKAAAYGLLARTYLSMRKYDSAWKYADLCLDINDNLIDYKGDPDINGNISNAVPFKVFNKEVIFHTTTNANYFVYRTPGKVDTLLYASFEDNDLRKIAFFRPIGEYFRFKGTYNDVATRLFSGIATDEIYLIRAECFARDGNLTLALQDLNSLLEKRYDDSFTPVTANDVNQALKRILLERRKELLTRGIRWIDIKRLNKEGENIILTRIINNQTYTLLPNANYFALPLPTDVINISGIPQNPK